MFKHFYAIYLVIFTLTAISTNVIAATQARLQVSQTSGVAPMAVHFDATATTDTSVANAFRELRYDFNFGDPNSGTWQYSGLSKNTQSGGPLAAHVYDNPGTYTATLRVGNDARNVTITVQDPNAVFSGTKTVCLSRSTDMSGCPPGAQRITNISSWPTITDNKRYMLKAGHNFSSLGQLSTGQIHNTRITSFGSGAKPIVGTVYLQPEQDGYGPNWISHVDVIGLNAERLMHGISGHDILWYQNEIHGVPGAIGYGGAFGWYKESGIYRDSIRANHNFFIIENVSEAGLGSHNGDGQAVWMGNRFGNTDQHTSRLWQVYKTFIAHNNYFGNSSNGGASNLKIHAAGVDPVNHDIVNPPSHHSSSRYLVVANNIFNSATSTGIYATTTIEPQTPGYSEGIQDVIQENNTHWSGGEGTFFHGVFGGRNITMRGTILGNPTSGYVTGNDMEAIPEWDGPYYMGDAVIQPPTPTQGTISMIVGILLD